MKSRYTFWLAPVSALSTLMLAGCVGLRPVPPGSAQFHDGCDHGRNGDRHHYQQSRWN